MNSSSSPRTLVRDFMTTDIISVGPEASLGEVSALLMKYNLSGLPVLDRDKKLLGIVTEYDLVSKGSLIHIPTFLKLLKDIDLYKKDKNLISHELQAVLSLAVRDVMNREPLTLGPDVPIEEAVRTFSEHHRVNPIPVIDQNQVVIGVLSRFDIMKLYIPATDEYSILSRKEQKAEIGVEEFLKNFEREFVLVRKARTRWWLITSLIFLWIGFLTALFFALKINIRITF